MPTLRQLTAIVSDYLAGKPAKLRSPKWPTVRRAWLQNHPTCAACGSKKALEVHHIKAFHEHPELELDPQNLMSLCDGSNSCHRTWGHLYNWKLTNPSVVDDITAWREHFRDRKFLGGSFAP